MDSVTPPKYVNNVMTRLESAGYSAYIVGGCVRDALMGRRPHDWDVCTDALPGAVLSIFRCSKPTGIKHGTVTVRCGKQSVEVTTFRAEAGYLDHRRPDSVSFITSLETDLSRRDFTMNAIAVSSAGKIYDPFGGKRDIERRLIRCVGEPEQRFNEDSLRMLRALRFSAALGFELDESCTASLYRCAPLVVNLAPERVRDELEKILLSPAPSAISRLLGFGLIDPYILRPTMTPDFSRLSLLPKKPLLRWAGLCAELENSGIIPGTKSFLTALRLDNNTISSCASGVDIALIGFESDSISLKRLLAKHGVSISLCAAAAYDVMNKASCLKKLNGIIGGDECYSLAQLNITGGDLIRLGYKGEAIGAELSRLLQIIIENPQQNEKSILLELCPAR